MRRITLWCLSVVALLIGNGSSIAQPLAWSNAQFEGAAVGDPAEGQRVAQAKCAVCHGDDGNSPNPRSPKLAGQNPAYLYWQLWAYKTGARTSDVMSGIAANLSDADAADVASFYGQQAVRPDSIKDMALASVGQRIFFDGAGSGMVPCATCHASAGQGGTPMPMPMMGHGMMGMMGHGMMARGMMPNIPTLNGQHAAYTIDELNRFARGERQGTVMNRVAAGLTETNEKAVAEFLSGLQ